MKRQEGVKSAGFMMKARRILVVLPFTLGWRSGRLGATACSCDVRFYQTSGFGNTACSRPGIDFGCYPEEDTMWIRPPCGSIFRCNADHHDVGRDPDKQSGSLLRCGSRYFRPAPGQTRLNCSCALPPGQQQMGKKGGTKHFLESDPALKRSCGAHVSIDPSGGVSSAYRRLPQPSDANPAVKCCRNKPTKAGPIDWNITLEFKDRNFAAWPSACEALCSAHPSGRCRYFSHSFRFNSKLDPMPRSWPCLRLALLHAREAWRLTAHIRFSRLASRWHLRLHPVH